METAREKSEIRAPQRQTKDRMKTTREIQRIQMVRVSVRQKASIRSNGGKVISNQIRNPMVSDQFLPLRHRLQYHR
jgi:hypothetical protein